MRFHVEDAECDGQPVWRIVGPCNEYVGRAAYFTAAAAEIECQQFNDAHAALEQAVKDNEIMELLSRSEGKVCALIDIASRVHFGRGNYKNVLLPSDVTPMLGDILLVKCCVITITKPKEVEIE